MKCSRRAENSVSVLGGAPSFIRTRRPSDSMDDGVPIRFNGSGPLLCARPLGAGPGPYDDFGSCEWVNQRFWDGHGWRVRRVRVCG